MPTTHRPRRCSASCWPARRVRRGGVQAEGRPCWACAHAPSCRRTCRLLAPAGALRVPPPQALQIQIVPWPRGLPPPPAPLACLLRCRRGRGQPPGLQPAQRRAVPRHALRPSAGSPPPQPRLCRRRLWRGSGRQARPSQTGACPSGSRRACGGPTSGCSQGQPAG